MDEQTAAEFLQKLLGKTGKFYPRLDPGIQQKATGIALATNPILGQEGVAGKAGKAVRAAEKAREAYDVFKGLPKESEARNLYSSVQSLWKLVTKARQLGLHHQAEAVMPTLQDAQHAALSHAPRYVPKEGQPFLPKLQRVEPERLLEMQGRVGKALDTLGHQVGIMEQAMGKAPQAPMEAIPVEQATAPKLAQEAPRVAPAQQPPIPEALLRRSGPEETLADLEGQAPQAPKPAPAIMQEAPQAAAAPQLNPTQQRYLTKLQQAAVKPQGVDYSNALLRYQELAKSGKEAVPGERNLLQKILSHGDYFQSK